MPGLHLVVGKQSEASRAALEKTLPTLEHDDGYHSRVLFRTDRTTVAASGYADYPLTIFDDEELLLVIEGRIYGLEREQLNRALQQLAALLDPARRRDQQALVSWLFDHPGDYLVLVHHKRHKHWSLISDPLARLPFYIDLQRDRAIMSREMRFVSALQTSTTIDRMGLAQFLMFGYQCGKRTLLDKVDILPSASLVEWNDRTGDIQSTRLHQFNFGEMTGTDDLQRAATRLTDLFVDASRKMAHERTVLGLSGGLDSRPVAAALVKAGIPFEARTFLDAAGAAREDVSTAREVARALSLNWSVQELDPCTGKDVEQIMRMKGGANFTASAVTLSFMKEIEKSFRTGGVYLSGDGGDKLMPLILPAAKLRSTAVAADFAMVRHALIEPKLVAAICGLKITAIKESLIETFSGYPEESPVRRYVHHLMFDRTGRWSYEGEDCNRCHLWSAAPFMHLPVYEFAFSLPDPLKENRRLHARLIANLSEAAAEIPPAGTPYPIGSEAFRHRETTKRARTRYPRLLRTVKRYLKPAVPVRNVDVITQCIRRQHAGSEPLQELLNRDHLERLLAKADRISAEGLHNILTATSAVLLHLGEPMLLEEFADREFD